MSLPKFRRLYFPGLISLIFLPVMCISYLVETNTFYKPSGMKIVWCDTKWFKNWHVASFRRYDTLNITGNSNQDIVMVKDLRNRISGLITKDDVENGVIIEFSDKSNYAEFINVLDICFLNEGNGLTFAQYRNRLYIAHVRLQTTSGKTSTFFWGNDVFYSMVPTPKPDFFSMENFKAILSKVDQFLKVYWAPALAFALMLFFTFNKRKRHFDLKCFRLTSY